MSKLVSVIATRSQGQSVINSLLGAGQKYNIRALVRNPDSDQAKKLSSQGVQVVKCDINNDSAESIQKAIEGSDSLFLVTVPWGSKDKESDIGKKAIDAAFSAKVNNLVFSGLAPANKISNGRYVVPHFDEKYQIEQYARDLSSKNPQFKVTSVYAPFYYQNFGTFFKPQKGEDGSYTLNLPVDPQSKYPLDMADINDIGPIVQGILSNPTKYAGLTIPFSGSALTGAQIADAFSKSSGKTVKFNYIPIQVFAQFPFPNAHEMADMFGYYNEYGAFDKLNKDLAKQFTQLTTFDQFLANNPIQLD